MNNIDITSPISIIGFLIKRHKSKIVILILLSAFIGLAPSVDGILLKTIIDTATSYVEDSDFISQMLFWAFVYFFWMESINLSYRLYDYVYLKSMPKLKGQVIEYFYDHIQRHSHAFFQTRLSGNISNRVMDTTKALEYFVSNMIEKIWKKVVSILSALVTIYWVNKVFAAIFALWLVLFCGISLLFSSRIKKLSANLAAKRSDVAGRIVDSISNINAVRMFAAHDYELKYLGKFIGFFIKSDMDMQWFMLKIRYVLGLLSSSMTFGMVYYLAQMHKSAALTIGDFALILSVCSAIGNEIWDLSEEIGDTFEDYGSFKQSALLLAASDNINDYISAKDLQVKSGAIEFRNVIFKYGDDILFNDKSIIIPGNQKIGLVGHSGSGKTSFVNLINRLYDVNNGEILIDGQDIAKISQESLRKAISFIPQEPILFQRTIRENIKYGMWQATDEEMFEAAKKAHIHDVIMAMPEQYDSLCGERGGKLSGGQRQRIIIARAILKNAPILILDEATSSLDSITEKQIQHSLEFLMRDKTVIVIAHRLATLLSMDRILVFDNGRIVEDGKHNELLQKQGLYSRFWNSQREGFID